MNWKETFKIHLIKMDKFFSFCKPPIKNDVKVYLAGYYARYLDDDYRNQIQPYIIKDIEHFKELIKKHHLKLGQNAPIFYYAKINAEYKMFYLLTENLNKKQIYEYSLNYQLSEPATLYSLTSTYYRISGQIYHALLFENIYKRIKEIFSILNLYSKAIHLNQKFEKEEISYKLDTPTEEEIEQFKINLKKEIQNQITEKEIKNDEINQILSKFFFQS
ncbi:MAG: hypothetical protein KatS3mg129_0374 [Leptospiraceae bacterium]|nr:MAG: hypothetical protein KatS3mg129_0374 [Leptospiraceae bacterium]